MSDNSDKRQSLIDILHQVLPFITADTDMVWTRYENWQQLRDVLQQHIIQITNGNLGSLDNLKILMAPTGTLQEHAIQNGWTSQYMQLAEQFDELCKALNV